MNKEDKVIWRSNYRNEETYRKVIENSRSFLKKSTIIKSVREYDYSDRFVFEITYKSDK